MTVEYLVKSNDGGYIDKHYESFVVKQEASKFKSLKEIEDYFKEVSYLGYEETFTIELIIGVYSC